MSFYEKYGEAVKSAKEKVKLLEWCNHLGIETRGQYATHCPFCQKRGKFHIRATARCYSSQCTGNKSMDHIHLAMQIKGMSFRDAGDALLSFANIPNPYQK